MTVARAEYVVRRAAAALVTAQSREAAARNARDEALRAAAAEGITLRRLSELAGISHQAVAKVVAAPPQGGSHAQA